MANNIIKRIWNQNKMVQIEDLKGMAFQAEDGGHTFEIYGIDEAGETVTLTGTPSGVFLRPDNTDVVLDCSVSDGVVSATLPDECYDVPGRGGLTVFITADGKKTALYAAVVTVSRTSSGTVAPPATQTVVDLINAISAAVATIPASYSSLMADIAPTYSDTALYAVGQYSWYDGDLKKCIVPITTAESYTAAHWTSAVIGDDISDLQSIMDYTYSEEESLPVSTAQGGIKNSGGSVSVSSSTAYKYTVINVEAGEIYTIGILQTSSSSYPYYGFFTKADGTIIKSVLPGMVSRNFLGDVIVPAGSEKMYVMCSRDGSFTISRHYTKLVEKDLYYAFRYASLIDHPITRRVDAIANNNGVLQIVDTTGYQYDYFDCTYGDRFVVSANLTTSANYPYFAFVVDSQNNILSSHLSNAGLTQITLVTEEIVVGKNASKLYVMQSRDLSGFAVKEKVPEINESVEEISNQVAELDLKVFGEQGSQALAEAGLAIASGHNLSRAGISFVFITDTHSNGTFLNSDRTELITGLDSKLSVSVFRKIAQSGMVDFGIHCGDIISAYNVTKEDYVKAISEYLTDYDGFRTRVLFVKGNHECNHEDGWYITGEDFTKTEYYSNVQRRDMPIKIVNPIDPFGGYYYCDFPEYKVRIIVLNAFINPQSSGINNSFGAVQDTWFAEVALSLSGISDANKWGVIVFCHPSASTNNTIKRLRPGPFSQLCPGTLIGYIHGHTHVDAFTNEDGFDNISVTRAYGQMDESGSQKCAVSIFTVIPSVEGDNSEGIIYETRIGRGPSRIIHYNQMTVNADTTLVPLQTNTSYVSEDESIATVNSSGVVHPVWSGYTAITGIDANNNLEIWDIHVVI